MHFLVTVAEILDLCVVSSLSALPESEGGTVPGVCSHTACRTSLCRKDYSPGRRKKRICIESKVFSHITFYNKMLHCIYTL